MATTIPSSVQEAAARFANTILASLNAGAAQTAGVDVMYFRATPDKRSQDVIFQSYTLYGVEDCPLNFRAVYSDTGYDDAAITYNIMGLNFSIPMTLDIALKTWVDVTGNDGTIPQEHDVVYIPMTRKLMEVVSMTPVKQIAGQLTSYKINLGIYKPTRSRIVGENLRDSIAQSTTNLEERFGDDIDKTLHNIVDPDQLSIHSSDSQDPQKTVTPTKSSESGTLNVRSIIEYDLVVDGHKIAKSYYDMSVETGIVVKYKRGDVFTSEDSRCLSFWMRTHGNGESVIKNLKNNSLVKKDGNYYLVTTVGKKFSPGESVIIKRGVITIPGTVENTKKIKLNEEVVKKLNKMNPAWYELPGFSLSKDDSVNVMTGGDFSISVKGGNAISIKNKENEKIIQLSVTLEDMLWYGIIINIGKEFSVDVYGTKNGFEKIDSVSGVSNDIYGTVETKQYYIKSSGADMTNIRLYSVPNTEIDKQMTDLLSYNSSFDAYAIINDGADIYLNKQYIGRQH